jgi:two-component system nitrate/nitrite response regulator NarL
LLDADEKVFPSKFAVQFAALTPKAGATGSSPPKSELSSRELEILRCLANGQSNKAIAKNLDIADATVKVLSSASRARRTP